MKRLLFSLLSSLLFLIVLLSVYVTAAKADTLQDIHAFKGEDGYAPADNLIADSAGNLYGTTEYGGPDTGDYYGTVFRLSPPAQAGGEWALTTLFVFTNDGGGARPAAGLLFDSAGNLYGTTSDAAAGGYGEVFKLSPPASGNGPWTETVLYSFKGTAGDGIYPQAGLIWDPAGNLYGTTQSSAFELSPPASKGGQWTFTLLHAFKCCTADGFSSYGGLVRDGQGNLYGTTVMGGFYQTGYCSGLGCGTVFELTPPTKGGSWTETVLYRFKSNINGYSDGFDPFGTPILDQAGNLYGTTSIGGALGGGTVFQLSPGKKAGPWKESILHEFAYGTGDGAEPLGNIISDNSGNLYGTTLFGGNNCIYNAVDYGCGTVFELSPTQGGTWNENQLYLFTRDSWAPRFPWGGLFLDSAGNLFGTTQYGGDPTSACPGDPTNGCGTVFELTP